MCELKRIRGGYRPVSNAWYYQILYDVCTLISVIIMRVKRIRTKHLRYKCPRCGKESDDHQVIFNCITDHEYNKSGDIQK
jgi:hypothetical protein